MNVDEVNNPGYEQPKKGGRSWLACFGIGCVVLVLLCGVGSALTYFLAKDQIMMAFEVGQLQVETQTMALDSDIVKEKLGDNVAPVFEMPSPEVTVEGDVQFQKNRIKLAGSEGEGYVYFVYKIQPGVPVERTDFYLEIDGEQFDLNDSDSLELNIDEPEMEDEGGTGETTADEEEPVGAGADG